MTQHLCHWPGCKRAVPPRVWGCKSHWFMLPVHLRNDILRAYVPGQEVTKTPSEEYVKVARRVQEWIENRPKG